MRNRFFVTILAHSQRALHDLNLLDVDVFGPTTRISEPEGFTVDGLLTLKQIGQLVDAGYVVTVIENADQSRRDPLPTISLEQWLEEMDTMDEEG